MSNKLGSKILRLTGAFLLAVAAVTAYRTEPGNASPSAKSTLTAAFTDSSASSGGKAVYFEAYENLPPSWQRLITDSCHIDGYEGHSGRDLYHRLTAGQRAGFMNIMAKAAATILPDGSSVLDHIREVRDLREARFFAVADGQLLGLIKDSLPHNTFFHRTKGTSTLHHAPSGFEKVGSYKTPDEQGNLDITISQHGDNWRAEIDIDECTGLCHLFTEVIPEVLTETDTNPFHVTPLLENQGIDPHYHL